VFRKRACYRCSSPIIARGNRTRLEAKQLGRNNYLYSNTTKEDFFLGMSFCQYGFENLVSQTPEFVLPDIGVKGEFP
jgi:hypothetical protein